MALEWVRDEAGLWDADKARIIGGARPGVFDRRYKECGIGERMPGDWWRATDGGRTVGIGWMDAVWGDAEILLATDPQAERKGVGSYVLAHLEDEAKKRGMNYVYNVVRPTHPDRARVSAWFEKRGFRASEDGSLLRSVTKRSSPQ